MLNTDPMESSRQTVCPTYVPHLIKEPNATPKYLWRLPSTELLQLTFLPVGALLCGCCNRAFDSFDQRETSHEGAAQLLPRGQCGTHVCDIARSPRKTRTRVKDPAHLDNELVFSCPLGLIMIIWKTTQIWWTTRRRHLHHNLHMCN